MIIPTLNSYIAMYCVFDRELCHQIGKKFSAEMIRFLYGFRSVNVALLRPARTGFPFCLP